LKPGLSFATTSALNHGRQQINALYHPMKIALRRTIEQADLHIHHNHCIHGRFPEIKQFRKLVTSLASFLNSIVTAGRLQ